MCEKMTARMDPLVVNGQDWGLADCDEVKVAPGVWRLSGPQRSRGVELPALAQA